MKLAPAIMYNISFTTRKTDSSKRTKKFYILCLGLDDYLQQLHFNMS